MSKVLRDGGFTVTVNQAFPEVIYNCAAIGRKDQPGTWITREMQDAYIRMHHEGYGCSVEVWLEGELVGGLYGLQIGRVFCGESMFSRVSNASKAALIWLCRESGFALIDCQLPNDHLLSLGAEMISREEYERYLSVDS